MFVAAAGNYGSGIDTEVYPARYPEVMSVGAVNQTLQIESYSSTGNEIDIVAPGSDILSTTADGEYGVMSGTSMATPHITGVAAALWAKNKKWSNKEVMEELYQTATPLGEQHVYGRGLVNEAKALGLSEQPIAEGSKPDSTPIPDSTDKPSDTSVSFDIIKKDIQFAEYKNKLSYFFDTANQNGQIELAKKIEDKLNELIVTETRLCTLPDNLNTITKEIETSVQVQSQINTYYATKANDFNDLENRYRQAIDEFSNSISVNSLPIGENKENIVPQNQDEINLIDSTQIQAISINESPSASGRTAPIKIDDINQLDSVTGSAISVSGSAISVSNIQIGSIDSVGIQSTPSLTIVSTTATTVTFSVVFPTSGARGNVIVIDRFDGPQTVYSNVPYDGDWYKTNGTFTITGLTPGGYYHIWMWWSTDGGYYTGYPNSIYKKVKLPYTTSEILTRSDGTYVFTNIESNDKNYATSYDFSRWMSHLDSSYQSLKNLTGQDRYNGGKNRVKIYTYRYQCI